MKAKNRKTGEIVDIISYNDISTTSISKYLVTYIDSLGVEHGREGTDYHLDFEPIDNLTHWQDVKERTAIAVIQGTLANPDLFRQFSYSSLAEQAVLYADALIEELKKK